MQIEKTKKKIKQSEGKDYKTIYLSKYENLKNDLEAINDKIFKAYFKKNKERLEDIFFQKKIVDYVYNDMSEKELEEQEARARDYIEMHPGEVEEYARTLFFDGELN